MVSSRFSRPVKIQQPPPVCKKPPNEPPPPPPSGKYPIYVRCNWSGYDGFGEYISLSGIGYLTPEFPDPSGVYSLHEPGEEHAFHFQIGEGAAFTYWWEYEVAAAAGIADIVLPESGRFHIGPTQADSTYPLGQFSTYELIC